jgi:HK97 family phage portal protein
VRVWPFRRRKPEQRAAARGPYSISDPMLAAMLGWSPQNWSGQDVSEETALTLSAVYRATSLVAGAIGGLPLRTLQTDPTGTVLPVGSFLDNPAGPDRQTPFEWAELVGVHLLMQGESFLQHVYTRGGAIAGLNPVHPLAVSVEPDEYVPGGKRMRVDLGAGLPGDERWREFDSTTMTHIVGLSLDGLRGCSPIALARNGLGTGLAADKAAAKMFAQGAMISGMVTPDDDPEEGDAEAIKEQIQAVMLGADNAGDIAVMNRRLKFTPWQLSAEDAQFLQSRVFQVEEIGRWWGVPPHLLGQTEKATSWGQGIAEQNRGLARYTLTPHTTRIEQRLSRLVPSNRHCEFDYSEFTAAAPEDLQAGLIAAVNAGLKTPNEARRELNLPPMPGGDVLRLPAGAAAPALPAPAPEVLPDAA